MIVILASHTHDPSIISEAKRQKFNPRILPCISTLAAKVALRRTGRQVALRRETKPRFKRDCDCDTVQIYTGKLIFQGNTPPPTSGSED